jgi:hypothetical protein
VDPVRPAHQAQGIKGDAGANGATGAAGAQGIKGDAGTTGAAGACRRTPWMRAKWPSTRQTISVANTSVIGAVPSCQAAKACRIVCRRCSASCVSVVW